MTKYRGFRKDGKGWVEGDKWEGKNGLYILKKELPHYEIHPESLAISTGLSDKHGKEIFGSIDVNGVMSKGGSRMHRPNTAEQIEATVDILYYKDGFVACNILFSDIETAIKNSVAWIVSRGATIIGNQYEQNG